MNHPVPTRGYHVRMTQAPPDLPEYMTWEQLAELPEEIAGEIELWDGRVVWVRRGPSEHQEATNVLWLGLRQCNNRRPAIDDEPCLGVKTESNVFLGTSNKSDFLTPDFLVHRCLTEFADIRGIDVLLVGEVLSKSNTPDDLEARKARYAGPDIAFEHPFPIQISWDQLTI